MKSKLKQRFFKIYLALIILFFIQIIVVIFSYKKPYNPNPIQDAKHSHNIIINAINSHSDMLDAHTIFIKEEHPYRFRKESDNE